MDMGGKKAKLTEQKINQAATELVMNLAAFKHAVDAGNMRIAQKYQDEVSDIAKKYFLKDDPELIKALDLDFTETPAVKATKGRGSSRQNKG